LLLRARPDGPAALLVRGPGKVEECASAAIIVSAEPARGLCPRPWPKLVDRFTVWREGAAAVWLDPGGVRIVTDRADRGVRPWTPPPPVAKVRPASKLPLAETDRPE
jgi:competence protein ComEC